MAGAWLKPKSKLSCLLLGALAGAATAGPEFGPGSLAESATGSPPPHTTLAEQKRWEAAAPGRVESSSRERRISAAILARIVEVLVSPNEIVVNGDLLIRLDDGDALARLAAAEAQVEDRQRQRDDVTQPDGSSDRIEAADAVADAERAVADARSTLDRLVGERRAGSASEAAVVNARSALSRAQQQLKQHREALRNAKAAADAPLPSRTEAALAAGRAEWTIAAEALERTRVRAPIAGTILQVQARAGEMASPSSTTPLATVGDLSGLRVRAELDERDVGKVKIGQHAMVRADAFKGRNFEGKVSSIIPIVGTGQLTSRSPQKFTDTEVMEVVIDLNDTSPLVVGLKVDVFFSSELPDR
jgi:HlyD family secretion protein